MACEDIEKRLGDLRAQKKQQEDVLKAAGGGGAGRQVMQEQLDKIVAQISVEERNLAECQAQATPKPPAPFTGRVDWIVCGQASKEVGKDEPYLLVASVDLLGQTQVGPLPVPKPEVHCFLIGPWSDVAQGSVHFASSLGKDHRPAFWDLDGKRRIVAQSTDVIFLAAMMEHDGASPDAIRGAVQTNLNGSIIQNLGRVYATLADTLVSAMTAAIDLARGAGVSPTGLNFDDRIGAVRRIDLDSKALALVNGLGRVELPITFRTVKSSGKVNNEYVVTFAFEQ